jgi:hypothetical protein
MNFLGIHFHSWKIIYQNEKYTFRNRECERDVETNYRLCLECNTIQRFWYDSQGGSWQTIPDCERDILNADMVFTRYNNGPYKYYIS